MKTLVWLASLAAVVLFGFYVVWPQVDSTLREAGWHFAPPAMARALPFPSSERDAYFTRRLQETFPLGTPQARVTATLTHEGFASEGETSASYKFISFRYACLCQLFAHWHPADIADKNSPIDKIDGEVLTTIP